MQASSNWMLLFYNFEWLKRLRLRNSMASWAPPCTFWGITNDIHGFLSPSVHILGYYKLYSWLLCFSVHILGYYKIYSLLLEPLGAHSWILQMIFVDSLLLRAYSRLFQTIFMVSWALPCTFLDITNDFRGFCVPPCTFLDIANNIHGFLSSSVHILGYCKWFSWILYSCVHILVYCKRYSWFPELFLTHSWILQMIFMASWPPPCTFWDITNDFHAFSVPPCTF